jgi:hypothetical protein
MISALIVGACSGGPSATPTPPPGATTTPVASTLPTNPPSAPPTPTVAPPTATALPEPTAAEIAAWAADICAVNTTFLADNQQITTDIPEPADRTLEALKQVNADRQPRVEQIYHDAVDALNALTPYPGGEPFRVALLSEMQSALDAMPAFFQAIADATSVEEVDAEYANRGTISGAGLLKSAQSVVLMDVAFSDAVAAITTGCRFFEYDARARVHGIATPDFSEAVFVDSFDDQSNFSDAAFEDGQIMVDGGSLTMSFTQAGGDSFVAVPLGRFHDARIESHLHPAGNGLAGLVCRAQGANRYEVDVNQIGLVLIYSQPGDVLLGRRAAPDGFDASDGVDLAIECLAGNLDPFTIVVYIDGERVAEVQQEHAAESEGRYGMLARSFASGAVATFDSIRVLVPAD